MLKYSPRLLAFHSKWWWNFKAACLFVPAVSLVLATAYHLEQSSVDKYEKWVNAKGLAELVCTMYVDDVSKGGRVRAFFYSRLHGRTFGHAALSIWPCVGVSAAVCSFSTAPSSMTSPRFMRRHGRCELRALSLGVLVSGLDACGNDGAVEGLLAARGRDVLEW